MIRVLGVDGGQSGTRLRDSDGREATAEGVSWLEGDTVGALADAVTAAWRLGEFDRVDRAVLGLTTAPAEANAADRLCALVSSAIGVSEVWLADDAVTAHAGALSLGWGVSVVVGTGVACLVLPQAGDARIMGGHGFLLGDEGGGFWIGRRALAAILRAHEGRDPSGEAPAGGLVQAAEREFGPVDEFRRASTRLNARSTRSPPSHRMCSRHSTPPTTSPWASSTTRRQSSCCSLPPRLAGPGPIKPRCHSRLAAGC